MTLVHNPTDWTKHPLHAAAMSGNSSEVERLLSGGHRARINETLVVEGTALHVASHLGHFEVVRLLLENGAAVDAKVDRFGTTPNHVGGAFSGTPLHDAVAAGHTGIAQLLLNHGADINGKEGLFHLTPLHAGVRLNNGSMVQLLISKGAAVNAVADHEPPPDDFPGSYMICPDVGMTPLHVAAREGFTTIARQLVAAGAAVDIKVARTNLQYRSYQGLTALELAKARLTDDDELIRLLRTPSIA